MNKKIIVMLAAAAALAVAGSGLILLSRGWRKPPERLSAKIGFLPITDHLILGISEERDGDNFRSLRLEPAKFRDWQAISEALRAGDIDGAFLLAPLAYQLKLKGAPVKIVMYGHRDGSALIVRVRDGINTVQDLRGKKIAIPHVYSTHNMLLHMYAAQAGLEAGKDFETVAMAPPDMIIALSMGEIDGYIVAEPFGACGELSGVGRVLVLSGEIWKHHPDCILVMREEYLKKNPAGMAELSESLIRSGIFAEEHREEAAEIGSRFLGHPLEAMKRALLEPKERVTFYDLMPDIAELERIQDYMAEKMGLFPRKVAMNGLVDPSFARAAYGRLGEASRGLEYEPRK